MVAGHSLTATNVTLVLNAFAAYQIAPLPIGEPSSRRFISPRSARAIKRARQVCDPRAAWPKPDGKTPQFFDSFPCENLNLYYIVVAIRNEGGCCEAPGGEKILIWISL